MNPVARAVSSLLKSSSVWSVTSKGATDEDREGGSELEFQGILKSLGVTAESSDCLLISDDASCIHLREGSMEQMGSSSYHIQSYAH